jgi:hypothetical protein
MQEFYNKMGWKATPTYDTASDVNWIENKLIDKAAIASARSG